MLSNGLEPNSLIIWIALGRIIMISNHEIHVPPHYFNFISCSSKAEILRYEATLRANKKESSEELASLQKVSARVRKSKSEIRE